MYLDLGPRAWFDNDPGTDNVFWATTDMTKHIIYKYCMFIGRYRDKISQWLILWWKANIWISYQMLWNRGNAIKIRRSKSRVVGIGYSARKSITVEPWKLCELQHLIRSSLLEVYLHVDDQSYHNISIGFLDS